MDGEHKRIGCLWPRIFGAGDFVCLFVCFYQPIILKLILVIANLSQKHVFSRFRVDHKTADFTGVSKLKQRGKRGMFLVLGLFQEISLTLIQQYSLQVASQSLCEDLELGKNCKKTVFVMPRNKASFEVVFMKKMPGLRTSASFCNLNFLPYAYKQTLLMSSVYLQGVLSFLS